MSKRKAKLPMFDVTLADEISGIPCGRRILFAEVGRKWAYVRERVGTGSRRRVPVAVWVKLAPQPVARIGRR